MHCQLFFTLLWHIDHRSGIRHRKLCSSGSRSGRDVLNDRPRVAHDLQPVEIKSGHKQGSVPDYARWPLCRYRPW